MKKTKLEKGITLIALIITIVVLLIIAVVTIGAVKESGIIRHSQNAASEYAIAQEKEKISLAASEAYIGGLGKITEDSLKTALNESIGAEKYSIDSSNSEYFKVTITDSGREYKVYKNGKVEGPAGGASDVLGVATVGIKVEKNSTIDGKAYSSTNPIIPAGFRAINTDTAKWDVSAGPETDKGLVIQDDSGNEFVWVPVAEDISVTENIKKSEDGEFMYGEPRVSGNDSDVANLQRAGCAENPEDDDTVLTSDDFKVQLTKEYKLMAESVNKYDGFYVGRFETSKNGTNPQSRRSSWASGSGERIVPVGNTTTENNWYGLYALNKKYSTSSVQGSMIWGIQYDKMMSWMGDAANTTISGYNTNITCGIAPNDVIKNVYDLYGNYYEWTLELTWEYNRTSRGGSYDNSRSPSDRSTHGYSTNTDGNLGSRLTLYIM